LDGGDDVGDEAEEEGATGDPDDGAVSDFVEEDSVFVEGVATEEEEEVSDEVAWEEEEEDDSGERYDGFLSDGGAPEGAEFAREGVHVERERTDIDPASVKLGFIVCYSRAILFSGGICGENERIWA
jgi:hypothetical protein